MATSGTAAVRCPVTAGRGTWLDALPYFYLARVQLLTLCALLLLPPVGLWAAPALLKGVFDVNGRGMILVALTAALASWTVMLTTWQVLLYGAERFHIRPFPLAAKDLHREPGATGHWVAFLFLALPVIATAVHVSASGGTSTYFHLIGGAMLGVALAWIVALCAAWMRGAKWTEARVIRKIFVWLGDGFRQDADSAYAGHYTAFWSFLICIVFYVAIGIGKPFQLGRAPAVPTLADLLVFVMIVCWGFSAVAFVLDKWRIPLVMLFLIWFSLSSHAHWTDHFFGTSAGTNPAAITPEAVLSGGKAGADVIVVAASGGGIKAAAWTTRVLTGLEEQSRTDFPDRPGAFGDSVRLVSAVSGGSVGAMYFVNAYSANGAGLPAETSKLEEVVTRSETSSLDDIAWGLVYPDFLRVFFPLFGRVDRGVALERALAERSDGRLWKPLAQWRAGVVEGWRPAVVFNATVVESGERLLMGTTDLIKLPNSTMGEGRTDLSDKHFQGRDVPIVTAVRLSASFPYVSPAARPEIGDEQIHIVDGGYTDNFGMATLLSWLDEGLRKSAKPVRRVLIIEIRASAPEDDPPVAWRGWPFQTYAPITTMLDVRDTGQLPRNNEERAMLKRAAASCGIAITDATFTYNSQDAPLSWHLSPKDKAELDEYWKTSTDNVKSKQTVHDFLAGTGAASAAAVPAAACNAL
jgi:patatin-like phospholipase